MKLQKIKEKLAAILVQMATIKTDKAVLEYDADEIAVGVGVFVVNEDGERTPAEDGNYTTEDGKVIVVKGGKVEAINEPTEETPIEETEEEIAAEETEEDAAPEGGEPIEEEPKSDDIENKIAELKEKLDNVISIVEQLVEKVGADNMAVDERLSKIEKMSAAAPAEETFDKTDKVTKTGNSKLDKQLERAKQMGRNWRD